MAAADRAEPDLRSGEVSEHWLWRDPSGAALAFHLEGDEIACVTPFFVASDPAVWSVHCEGPAVDPECVHCSGLDCDVQKDGEMLTRATVQLLHYEPYEAWLRQPRDFQIAVVAFAHLVDVFADREAFAAAMKADLGEDGANLAENFFVPVGMLEETAGGMIGRARAVFAGRITEIESQQNTLAGGEFWHARVDTYPGFIDVVFPAAAAPAPPEVGSILRAEAWLVARPTERP